eukprot:jgi/Orpsp1_1/1191559/evm.model.d7180000087002.1
MSLNQTRIDFIRHFPKIKTIPCCCCVNFKTAVTIYSFLMTIVVAAETFLYNKSIFGLIMHIIVIISQIFLCIGLFNYKLLYLEQFIFIFGIYLIFIVFEDLIIFFFGLTYVGSSFVNYDKFNDYGDIDENLLYILFAIFEISVFVYYYLAVSSYIENTIVDSYAYEQKKAIEENSTEELISSQSNVIID